MDCGQRTIAIDPAHPQIVPGGSIHIVPGVSRSRIGDAPIGRYQCSYPGWIYYCAYAEVPGIAPRAIAALIPGLDPPAIVTTAQRDTRRRDRATAPTTH